MSGFLYGLLCSRLVPAEKWHSISPGAMLFEGKDDNIKIALGPLFQRLTDPARRERFL